MVALSVKVPSKYKLLPTFRIRKKIPENWGEVNRKQLIGWCKALLLAKDEIQARILAARYMLGLPWWLFFIVNKYQLAEITLELHWLNQKPLTLNHLPELYIWKGVRQYKLLGPADNFKNLKFGEFAVASIYFRAYHASQNPDHLDHLVAVIYRPVDRSHGGRTVDKDALDKRVRFQGHLLSGRVRLVRKLSAEVKLAVLLYFGGCLSDLGKRYPELFGQNDHGQMTMDNGHESSDWLDFMRHLPADKFGTLEHIENSYIHPIMEVANRMMKDSKKEKARLELQKRMSKKP